MCGRAFNPSFMFAWPNARTAVMGGEQAASVLAQVARAGKKNMNESVIQETENRMRARYENESHSIYGSARLWDDGVIDPADTRQVLGMSLGAAMANWKASKTESQSSPRYGVFRM